MVTGRLMRERERERERERKIKIKIKICTVGGCFRSFSYQVPLQYKEDKHKCKCNSFLSFCLSSSICWSFIANKPYHQTERKRFELINFSQSINGGGESCMRMHTYIKLFYELIFWEVMICLGKHLLKLAYLKTTDVLLLILAPSIPPSLPPSPRLAKVRGYIQELMKSYIANS
jgi:hypothetical protein